MKKLFLLLFLVNAAIGQSWAQDKKYDIAVGYGFYKAPNLDRARAKGGFWADFEYHLSEKWTIASGFMEGRFIYYDTVRANIFPEFRDGPTATNGKGIEAHRYLTIAHSVVSKGSFRVQVSLGAGLYTRTLKYPYRGPSTVQQQYFTSEESFTKFELPLKADMYYMLNKRIGLGAKGGAFLLPDGSLVSAFVSSQLRFRL